MVVPAFGLVDPESDHIGPSSGLGREFPSQFVQKATIGNHGLIARIRYGSILGQGSVLNGGIPFKFGPGHGGIRGVVKGTLTYFGDNHRSLGTSAGPEQGLGLHHEDVGVSQKRKINTESPGGPGLYFILSTTVAIGKITI